MNFRVRRLVEDVRYLAVLGIQVVRRCQACSSSEARKAMARATLQPGQSAGRSRPATCTDQIRAARDTTRRVLPDLEEPCMESETGGRSIESTSLGLVCASSNKTSRNRLGTNDTNHPDRVALRLNRTPGVIRIPAQQLPDLRLGWRPTSSSMQALNFHANAQCSQAPRLPSDLPRRR